ncbi:hypothetical protein STAS_25053 [Striga asiatica]|uniref:Uncharacterized protein n=1 Tax=Striga asiatica TaxID=4170 RepID=A0A5A7QRD8_STRAF|nr:hypothetical protein STAS_25053 [Striga asiatica]
MKLQSACVSLQGFPPPTRYSPPRLHTVSNRYGNHTGMVRQLPRFKTELKSLAPFLRNGVASRVGSHKKLGFRVDARKWPEPFKGKPGYVSFGGLSHQAIEESRLVSAPFKEGNGSFLWVLAPAVLISSLVVPQFFMLTAIENAFRNEVFAEILSIFSCEAMFYAGVAAFLFITERVQKPYLEFSPRRWSLITGLRGYLMSTVFIMGLKVFAPILAVYVTWPVLGLPALVSVAPFLTSCLAQFLFEKHLKRNRSSCWPILPIIFEVYRIYQLTRAVNFIEKLIYGMREATITSAVTDRIAAMISMVVTFRVLGVVCLWSLFTFLMRLFPSRPVSDNY